MLLLWKTLQPVEAETGLRLLPHATLRDCPPLDVVCVPGGPGVDALMEDAETLEWLRAQAEHARYVSSVCTGALVLGAARLLRNKHATTHWASRDLLAASRDSDRGPGGARRQSVHRGGVTAGIDFALTMVAELAGPAAAQAISCRSNTHPRRHSTPEPPKRRRRRLSSSARAWRRNARGT